MLVDSPPPLLVATDDGKEAVQSTTLETSPSQSLVSPVDTTDNPPHDLEAGPQDDPAPHQLHEMPADEGGVRQAPPARPPARPPLPPLPVVEHDRRRFGMRKFLIIAAGSAIVILAAVGGTVGGILAQRAKNSSSPTPLSGSTHRESKLAAISWRDPSNNTVKAVFYQDPSNALLMSKWNVTLSSWVVTNITENMAIGGWSISPKTGTPLTATVPDFVDPGNLDNFWTDLYFMTTGNIPFQIWNWLVPQRKDLWHPNSIQTYDLKIFPNGFAARTQIVAYRDQCPAMCSNSSRFLYQGGDRKPMLAFSNVTNWQVWETEDLSQTGPSLPGIEDIEDNSSLAMTRFSPNGTAEPAGMRIYVDISNTLKEYVYFNGTWTEGSLETWLGDSRLPPQVAAVAYSSSYASPPGQALDNILLAILFENGTIVTHFSTNDRPGQWQMGHPSPSNVTALAISQSLKAYCLVDGQIQEYDIDRSNPSSWTRLGNVTAVVG